MDSNLIKYEDLGNNSTNNNFNNEDDDSIYYEYARHKQEQQWNNIRQTLKAVSEINGDKAGEIQRFKEQFNLPEDFDLKDDDETFEYIKKRKREEYILNQNFARINPVLAKQLEDPKFAALAHDNIEHLQEYYTTTRSLTAIPRFVKNEIVGLPQGIHKGWLSNERGLLGYQLMTGDENNEYHQGDRIKKFIAADIFGAFSKQQTREEKLARIKEIDKKIGLYNADGVGWLEAGGYYFGQWGRTLPAAATTGIVTAKINAKIGALTGSVVPGKGTVVGGIIGATTGLPAAYNYMFLNSYMVEGGNSYLDAIQRVGGLNHEDAAKQAHIVGLLAGGVERIGLPFLFGAGSRLTSKTIVGMGSNKWLAGSISRSGLDKKLQPAWNMFNKRILRKATNVSLSDKFEQLTKYSVSRSIFADIAQNVLTENATEVTQELINIIGYNIAAEMATYETTNVSAEETAERILNVLADTTKGMLTFGILTSGGGYYRTANNLRQSDSDQQYIDKMLDITQNDKTLKRNKNLWQRYMDLVGERNGVKDFYIDAKTFQQQLDDNDISMEQLELFSPELSEQLKRADEEGLVGKNIKITTGDYLANVAGTEFHNILRPHIRLGAETYSQAEFQEVYKIKDEMLDKALSDIKKGTEEFKQSQREARAYKKQIKEQLIATGQYTKESATALANLPLNFALTFAKRSNMSIKEFLNKYLYSVQFEGKPKTFGDDFFNQDGSIRTESTLFKNWFGKSKMKNADGTPMIAYHGTTASFDRFDLDNPNKYDMGFLGKGIYLTLNEGHAKRYARQKSVRTGARESDRVVMPLYVRLENPYRETDQNRKRQIKEGGIAARDNYKNKLISEGYDGVLMVNPTTNEVTEVVVFDPNAVKSVNNKGSWSREVDNIYEQQLQTFEQQGKQQEQGKLVPQAVFQIARIVENFDFAKSKPFATNRQFKLEIQNRVKNEAKKAGIDLSKSTIERDKYLVQVLLDDARFALRENANAVGWYNEKVTKAMKVISLAYPKIATDIEHSFAFKWALAATSNGIDVNTNFRYASAAYEYFDQNGKLPESFPEGGQSRLAMEISFQTINQLIEEKGFAEVEQFMKTKHTRREVEAFTGKEVTGGFGMEELVYGSAIIGPKIGNGFFANLYGNYEQLTLDRWAMRTWGRMTGTLVNDKTRQAKIKREHIKQIIRSLSKEQKKAFEAIIKRKLTLGDIDAVAIAIEKSTTKPANRAAMMQIATFTEDAKNKQIFIDIMGQPKKGDKTVSLGDLLRKRGNGLAKDLDGQKEVVSGAPERRNVEKVFTQVLNILQQDVKDLTMSDLQALVWYPEKKLYDSAKLKEAVVETGYEDNAAPDYANAAVDFAVRLGVSDADIQSALQEVDNDLSVQSEERTTGTQRDDGGSVPVRTDGETFQQQRNIDETTGLPINPDGTVTVYHHTNRRAAESIKATGKLRSAAEPDVYVTTRAIADTGYGDTAVAIRVEPSRLSLDDEFPNGRKDYRLSVGKPAGSIQVTVGEYYEQQASDGARGRFEPTTLTTILTSKADFSTFAHETAHYMLTVLENIVTADSAPQELTADFNTLLKFWKVKDIETWKNFSLEQKREYHEAFAYNFELYLSEGKSPNMDKGMISLFRKFARYIKDVYEDVTTRLNELYKRETGKDLPMLTKEVRDVMDRMLATDEQIVQANLMYDLKALFETQESSGMNDAEWAQYTAALQEAEDESLEIMTQQSMKQVRWINNKRDKVKKELDKKILKIRKKVEAEVTKEVNQDKRYKLKNFLKRGKTINDKGETVEVEGIHKISIKSIKELTPFYDEDAQKAEIKQLGTGQYGLVGKQGLDVKIVADMFDFDSPLAMIDALLELPKIEDVITERTDQRMLEEYSDLVDPKQLELQVQEAIHNEARARFVAVELNTLSKVMRPVRYQVAAARQVAQDILADKKLSEIKPSEFTRAEARALKEAESAMKKGDTKEAIKAKRSQLINNQLAKEAIEIQKEYNKAIKVDFIKFFKTDKELTKKSSPRNMDIISAGRVILASYNIGPKVKDINVFTEDLRKYDEQLYAELEPMILDAQSSNGRKDITDLTYEEFQNLYDLSESLWHQSRRAEQIKIAGKLLDLQPVIDTLVNRMDVMIQRSERLKALEAVPIGTTKAVPKSYLRNKDILGFGAKLRRMESWVDSMDGASGIKKGLGSAVLELEGGKLGDFYNTLWFPIKSALDEYRAQQQIFTKQYSDLVASVDFGNTEIIANEFTFVSEESEAYTFGSESNGRGKVELLGAMLHTGNESNLRKLLLGRKWGKLNEDGSLDRSAWDAFETRMKDEGYLTKQDYDFLQSVWDLNEKMLPLLQRAHKDTEGYYFKTVQATPILNRFGEFRGGYVPAKGDPYMTDVDVKEEISILKTEFKNSLPKVESGMTKERIEKFAQPLSLHLGFMTKHIDDTLRYAYIQPVLQDTLKVLNNKDFKKKLGVIDPTILDEMIMPWLKAAASQKTYAPTGFGARFDRILATIKRRTGIGIMFANIGNAFQQLTGLFPALIKVKPKYLKDGLITYMKDREGTNQKIAEMSLFMADRQKNLIFDIQDRLNELIINPNNFQKLESWGKHHGYFLQQTFQGITDSIVWMGTYNQVHETMPKNMSSEEVMNEAIKQADANVRLTQDSLLPEDRAAFQNMNPIVQSLTQFTGYFNMIANLSFTQHQKLVKDELGFNNKGKNTEQLVYMFLYTTVMPAVLAGIIMRGLGGRIDDEDEDGYILDDMASAAFGDIVNYTAGLVPIAGQVLLIPLNQFNDKPWDDDIVSSPGIEALQDSLRSIPKLVETIFTDGDLSGKDIRDISTMVTIGSGLPVTPLGKTLGYLRDVQRGHVAPKGPIDFVRGLITGKAGAGKK